MADEIPMIDFSSLSLSIGSEALKERDLRAAAEQLMNAFDTIGVARLSNVGFNQQLVVRPSVCPSVCFTARCYASAVLAIALCPSVCPSVRPSQVGVLLKRLNIGSHKQHHTIVQGL